MVDMAGEVDHTETITMEIRKVSNQAMATTTPSSIKTTMTSPMIATEINNPVVRDHKNSNNEADRMTHMFGAFDRSTTLRR